MKRILLLSYYWPPASGPGVQRWVKMSNHLLDLGFKITVITVADGSYPSIDKSLEDEVDPRIEVIKTKTMEPFALFNRLRGKSGKEASVGLIGLSDDRSLLQRIALYVRANYFVPDGRMGWRKYALRAAEQLLKSQDYDAVISSGPPHSVHAVAQTLKKRYGLKWLADLRDPWVNIHYHEHMPLSDRARAKHQRLENATLREADAVCVVSPGMKREFEDRADRISVIYNGYDERDFSDPVDYASNKKFTIRYTGNLKPNQDVDAFWQAIQELSAEHPSFAGNTCIELIGKKDELLLAQRMAELPDGIIVSKDPVGHSAAVTAMRTADLLLFIIPQAKNNELILTGKLFEYLASCTPLISIGPVGGDAAEILSRTGRSSMLDYANTIGIKEQILLRYEQWQTMGATTIQTGEAHTAYSRASMARSVTDLLLTKVL